MSHECGVCHVGLKINDAFAVEGDTLFCTPECWFIYLQELQYLDLLRASNGGIVLENANVQLEDYDAETVE